MVKPNPWLLTGAIIASFALLTHKLLADLNDAWDIW